MRKRQGHESIAAGVRKKIPAAWHPRCTKNSRFDFLEVWVPTRKKDVCGSS